MIATTNGHQYSGYPAEAEWELPQHLFPSIVKLGVGAGSDVGNLSGHLKGSIFALETKIGFRKDDNDAFCTILQAFSGETHCLPYTKLQQRRERLNLFGASLDFDSDWRRFLLRRKKRSKTLLTLLKVASSPPFRHRDMPCRPSSSLIRYQE